MMDDVLGLDENERVDEPTKCEEDDGNTQLSSLEQLNWRLYWFTLIFVWFPQGSIVFKVRQNCVEIVLSQLAYSLGNYCSCDDFGYCYSVTLMLWMIYAL